MKRTSCFAVCAFLSFSWISMASAGPNNSSVSQDRQVHVSASSPEFGQMIIRPKAGISWKEKVMKQRDIHKRALARRNVLMQQAEIERRKNPKDVPQPPTM